MKQAILTFEKCRVLLKEVSAKEAALLVLPSPETIISGYSCKPIGKLSELTEEQLTEIVDTHINSKGKGYRHYWKDNGFVPRGFNAIHKSAKQSFLSKLEAEGSTTYETPKVLSDSENSLSAEELERNFQPSRTWVFTIKQ